MSKMHKKDVRNADLNRLSILVKLNKTSNDFNVKNALRPLSGKLLTTENIVSATGSSYGLRKATTSDNYAIYQDTVISNSKESKTTGLGSCPKSSSIIDNTNTLSMMPLIFTKMAA
jgi:hypothetical protein